MDKYIRKIITALGHHLKPIQGGTIRKKGRNGHHNVEDTYDCCDMYRILLSIALPVIELVF